MRDVETNSLKHSGDYIPTLDGWRAVAILGVVACHASGQAFGVDGVYPNERIHAWLYHGARGVDVFFAISGYLICSRLIAERERTGGIDVAGFYMRRTFRILPAYWVYLSAVALVAWLGSLKISGLEWWSCILFWRNYLPDEATGADRWYLCHFWSLAVEEQFYLLLPGILVFAGAQRSRRLVIFLAILASTTRAVAMVVTPGSHVIAATRLDSLLWGCAYAYAFSDRRFAVTAYRWLSPRIGLIVVALAAGGITGKLPGAAVWLPCVMPAFLLMTVRHATSFIGQVLERPLLRLIGRLSYSLYLWQQITLPTDLSPNMSMFHAVQIFPINIGFAALFAVLSYYVVEVPMLRIGRELIKSWNGRRISAAQGTWPAT